MKRAHLTILVSIIALPAILCGFKLFAQGTTTFQTSEYGTIRWSGRDNTFFVRPNGKVESLGPLLAKIPRPDRVDERTFYMTVAVNAVAREGFEVAAITSDEIILKRAASR